MPPALLVLSALWEPPDPSAAPASRGSVWFTGSGFPTDPGGLLVGDMYLDDSNGDVYRFNGSMWTRGSF